MMQNVVTHQLVCTRCGTCVWERSGSIEDACWCGGRESATVTIATARKMRSHEPSVTLLSDLEPTMSYDDYVIYKAAPACTCDLCLLAARLEAELAARRAVVAAANVHQATCPTCGQPMPGGVPAQPVPGQLTEAEREALAERLGDIGLSQAVDEARGPHDDQVIVPAPAKDANIANEPKPSGYMSKPKML